MWAGVSSGVRPSPCHVNISCSAGNAKVTQRRWGTYLAGPPQTACAPRVRQGLTHLVASEICTGQRTHGKASEASRGQARLDSEGQGLDRYLQHCTSPTTRGQYRARPGWTEDLLGCSRTGPLPLLLASGHHTQSCVIWPGTQLPILKIFSQASSSQLKKEKSKQVKVHSW